MCSLHLYIIPMRRYRSIWRFVVVLLTVIVNIVTSTLEGSSVVISAFLECVHFALFMLVASAAAVVTVRNVI